jgi:hypothetical protein
LVHRTGRIVDVALCIVMVVYETTAIDALMVLRVASCNRRISLEDYASEIVEMATYLSLPSLS